jgi:D-threo-aldose 1-dehydrogenase
MKWGEKMDPFERKEIGTTGIEITRIGLGARGIVDPNVTVSDSQAKATVETSLELGANYIDTSPRYGLGRSELLVGQSALPDNRDEYVVSTKVGRLLDPRSDDGWVWDFSGDGVRRSLESSLDRLGLDRVDMLFIHSPTNHHEVAITEAYPALAELRSAGVVGAIGVGMTECEALRRFAQEGQFDCLLLACRYTLLDQSALTELLPYCQSNDIGIVVGGPYNSGILASDLGPDAQYDYHTASPETLTMARRIRDVCARYNVPLKAAALQFILAHPAVTSVIPGSSYPAHVRENVEMAQLKVPSSLWEDLRDERLIDPSAPVPS